MRMESNFLFKFSKYYLFCSEIYSIAGSVMNCTSFQCCSTQFSDASVYTSSL